MAANVYECMHILDSNRYARDPDGVNESIDSMVTKFEGEILISRVWNEQKLAYPVDGHRKGIYWLSYIRIHGSRLVELERAFQLNENVLRSLTLKLDSRLVEPMVAHARGVTVKAEKSEPVQDSKRESPATDNSDDGKIANDQ